MSRYILIHRLRGPAILLLIGVIALLHQAGVVEHFWHLFWPLLLILVGVLLLAERAALAVEGYPAGPYPGAPVAAGPNAPTGPGQAPPAGSSSIVPASHDFGNDQEGGQS
ncbi:MAG: DUF5668 domain-containing protein [Terracidiphilus sp.]|jgi:hypothetical protein